MIDLQKQMAIPAEGVLAGKGGKEAALPLPPKPAQQKKVAVKPKPDAVIVISSSETEQVKREKHNRKKANEASSSKKKGQTLTSTLTARSKVCDFSLYNNYSYSYGCLLFLNSLLFSICCYVTGCLRFEQ